MSVRFMTQDALYPWELDRLVADLTLPNMPGWEVTLEDTDRGQGCKGLTLCVKITGPDSYRPHLTRGVMHYFIVPAAAYDTRSWRRWLFEQLHQVLVHELCEGFTIGGAKPYAPSHGDGNDPYMVREIGTEQDQRMSSGNELGPPAVMPDA